MPQLVDNIHSTPGTSPGDLINDPAIEPNRLNSPTLTGKFMRYPEGNFTKNHAWIVFRELKDVSDPDKILKTKVVPTGNVIYLYLPKEGIQVSDKATYENASLGLLGKFVETNDDLNVGHFLDLGTKSITDAFSSLTNLQESNMPIVSKMLQTLKNVTPGPVNQGAISRIKRTANPQLRALFQQVDRRSFNYSFEFVPDNPREARNIREIVNFFRKSLYPEVEGIPDGGEIFSDFSYKFPNKFEIGYYFDNKRIGHRLLPCYLESVKVSYSNQSSMTFYPDGEFVSTKIDLGFIEESALSKERVDPANYTDGVSY